MNNNNFIIRFARMDDAKILADFNVAMAKESEELELDYRIVLLGIKNLMLQPELGFYLVAESDHKILGSLMITFEWTDWRNGIFWWVQSVYVRPEFRKMGVYKALYEYVKQSANNDERVKGFRLYVDRENKPAIEVYKKLGMKESNYLLFEEIKK